MDERHKYLLVTVADCLGLDYSEVEDAILDGTQVRWTRVCDVICIILHNFVYIFQIEMIDAFLAANGVARLIFFYQEPEAPPPDTGGDVICKHSI